VLILSASSGAGHVRAGEALEKAFQAGTRARVTHRDALKYTTRLFQKLYDDAYIAMLRHVPALMGWLYDRFDRPWEHRSRRAALERLNTAPMIRLLERVQPDLCISTHFLPAGIISWLKERRRLRARHAVVVTDFDVHAMWICRRVDRYYVALEEAAEYLTKLDVAREAVRVSGIPIDPVFEHPLEQGEARRALGLDPGRPTVLVTAGGHGIGPMERIVSDLVATERPWQVAAICGKAEALRTRLSQLARRTRGATPLHVVGFTTGMHTWMAAANLLVGKAGGLTVSESLASGLPLAIVDPVPGQEERNADHLLERGVAIRVNNLVTAAWKIAQLIEDGPRLQRMRAAARRMARPRAAAEIVADSVGMPARARVKR
jgi:processive 1,2-diacylglycerol beta-glucosyltransferase